MEVGSIISSVLTDDWTKDLQAAPKLIRIMGLCAALATKKEIISMELQDTRLANKGLLSNLLHLSNHGQSAFQQAHSDTYKISIRAEEIGRAEGYIDRIIKNFGKKDPRARKRLERALRGLEQQVQLSKAEGELTEAAFKEWKDKTDILHEAVASKQVQTQKTYNEKMEHEQQMDRTYNKVQRETVDAKNEFESAAMTAQRAQNAAAESYNQLRSAGGLVGKFAIGAATGVLGLALFGICEGFNVYSKNRSAREAEHRLELQTKMLRDLERELITVQEGVNAAKSETQKWDEVCKAVTVALENLSLLQHHVRQMVQYFSCLSDQIAMLSERCNEEFHKFVLESEATENGEADEDDFEELLEMARQIKAFALVVHAKAKIYSSISQNELFQGFQLISRLSNRSPLMLSDQEYIERSIGDLTLYQGSAESGIAKSVHEVGGYGEPSTLMCQSMLIKYSLQSKVRLFEECKRIYPTLTDDSPLNPDRQQPPPYTSGLGHSN
ncbi:hypothetical protein TWF730_006246 [Orbilia blumenaviensis]|uniref:Uncharacterized protein n=1 Tax=Orbilia blumenaviensis TaxID=1796055 RepID=A0AAV9VFA5_9PEZI